MVPVGNPFKLSFNFQATVSISQTSKEDLCFNAWSAFVAFVFASTRLRLRGIRSAVSRRRPTTHAARIQTQSVSQAATEVPVLQIWTDQSLQP